jgi:hypothetical protein
MACCASISFRVAGGAVSMVNSGSRGIVGLLYEPLPLASQFASCDHALFQRGSRQRPIPMRYVRGHCGMSLDRILEDRRFRGEHSCLLVPRRQGLNPPLSEFDAKWSKRCCYTRDVKLRPQEEKHLGRPLPSGILQGDDIAYKTLGVSVIPCTRNHFALKAHQCASIKPGKLGDLVPEVASPALGQGLDLHSAMQ